MNVLFCSMSSVVQTIEEINNSQQEEQSLRNVSQYVDNNSNDNQQVKPPVNKSDKIVGCLLLVDVLFIF
jgi:hypothetical protein